jgi:EmrB/QacA subfamily drug resistance transporter
LYNKLSMNSPATGTNKRTALAIAGLGAFLGTLDSSIVNVSLPTISSSLQTTVDLTGWVVLSYSIAIVSLLLVFGALAEKKGFSFTYSYGFSIFIAGSFLCGVSPNIVFLILSRAFQGIGAALLMAVGPALITQSFLGNERGRGLSVIGMVVSTGLMLGPPLGGFVIGWLGWRWIFFINIPVGIIGILLTIKYLRNFPILNPVRKISIPGAGSLAAGLFLMMIFIFLYGREAAGAHNIIIIFVASIAFLALFIYFEDNPRTRLIGLEIFRNRIFSFSSAAMFLVFISLASVTILMPFYLERVKLLQPQQVGLYLMIIPLCTFFMSPLSGYLSDKLQPRIISTIGIVMMASGIFLIRFFDIETTLSHVSSVLVLIGAGIGLFTTPNTSSIMGAVDRQKLGIASGIIATNRTLGIAFGVGLAVASFEYFNNNFLNSGMATIEAFTRSYRLIYNYVIIILIFGMVFSLVRGKAKIN